SYIRMQFLSSVNNQMIDVRQDVAGFSSDLSTFTDTLVLPVIGAGVILVGVVSMVAALSIGGISIAREALGAETFSKVLPTQLSGLMDQSASDGITMLYEYVSTAILNFGEDFGASFDDSETSTDDSETSPDDSETSPDDSDTISEDS
ncbi:unnamed protein product, partial [Meganyctiphanes norvegica]